MRGYVGLTDFDWYTNLSRAQATEANFWTPSARPLRLLKEGEPLLFLLKKPMATICGFGLFQRYHRLPLWLAWDTFGTANGVDSLGTLVAAISRYRNRTGAVGDIETAEIGCIVLEECVWFDEQDWVKRPDDWHNNIVSGKGYSLLEGEGKRVWLDVIQRAAVRAGAIPLVATATDAARYGNPTVVKPRLGQGAFRLEVLEAYGRSCAVTTEHSLPVLEAAHLKPYAAGGPHEVSNGLLLRTDIHRLLDRGYVTVDNENRFEVSRRLKDDYENGRVYYAMHGQKIHLPNEPTLAPSPEFVEWHNNNVFLG